MEYSNGRKHLHKGKLLALTSIDKDGYKQITLYNKDIEKHYKVHKLVALTFIPNPKNLPVINHKDTNKQNNSVENLEWCTISYNTLHGYYFGNSNRGEIMQGQER